MRKLVKAILAAATVAALAMVAKSGEPTNHALTATFSGGTSVSVLNDGNLDSYHYVSSLTVGQDYVELDFGSCKAIGAVAMIDVWPEADA